MIGGQMMDLEIAGKKISKETLANLHRKKTGELFMSACEMGAVLGHATLDERKIMRYFAHDLGLAFQIQDDILDHIEAKSGKIEIDETRHKKTQDNASIVDAVGLEQSKKQLDLLKEQAIDHLKIFGDKAKILVELTEFVVSRKK